MKRPWRERATPNANGPSPAQERPAAPGPVPTPRARSVAEVVARVGVGEKEARLARTREVLRAEGLFDPSRKRALPRLPRTIGLVTSPTGAAIRDVLSTIDRRFPLVRVVVSPVRVTGEVAAPEIA